MSATLFQFIDSGLEETMEKVWRTRMTWLKMSTSALPPTALKKSWRRASGAKPPEAMTWRF